MAQLNRTNTALTILGIVLLGVVGYFVWTYLAPPPSVTLPTRGISTEVDVNVISSPEYAKLKNFVVPAPLALPGKKNPFEPLPKAVTTTPLTP